MDVAVQIIASGLTLGAMYAVSTVGLALVYGSLNMLNMAHGALLALGGYVCFYAMTALGLHPALRRRGGHDRLRRGRALHLSTRRRSRC